MLRWLNEKLSGKRINDPFFGSLRFRFMRIDRSKSFWEGFGLFAPTGTRICQNVRGDANGPGEPQRAVYQRIVERYSELLLSITPLLEREYRKQMEGEPTPLGEISFALNTLWIPAAESASMEWEMDFYCVNDSPDWIF